MKKIHKLFRWWGMGVIMVLFFTGISAAYAAFTFTNTGIVGDSAFSNLTIPGLASSGTQCLHISSTGVISGTGSDCGSGGGGGSSTWGSITGTLGDQTDLQTALDLKAPLADPTFTGTATLSTLTISGLTSSSTQCLHVNTSGVISGTGSDCGSGSGGGGGPGTWGSITGTLGDQTDLQTALNLKAPLADPIFTGTVTLNNSVLNSSMFVGSSLGAGTGSGLSIPGTGLTAGSVYYMGAGGLALARANAASTVPGICVAVSSTSCVFSGIYKFASTQSWGNNAPLYVSAGTAGLITSTAPSSSGQYVQRIGVAIAADTILILISPDVGGIQ